MGKTVLITGASAGMGYELSTVFEKNGYNLVLVSRNKPRLEVIASKNEHIDLIQLNIHFDNPFFKQKKTQPVMSTRKPKICVINTCLEMA